MSKWYCKIKGTTLGPFTKQELFLMAEKGKLRPRDPVRSEKAMDWIKARQIDGLFTHEELEEDLERAEEQRTRKQKRKESDATVGYYQALAQNFRYGGEWLGVVIKTVGINAVLGGLVALAAARDAAYVIPIIIVALVLSSIGLLLWMMIEAAVFGVPMMLFRKDWSRIDVMDVFAYSYFYGLIANIFVGLIMATNPRAGVAAFYLLPVLSAFIFAYLVCTRWDIKLWIAILLALFRLVLWIGLVVGVTFIIGIVLAMLQ